MFACCIDASAQNAVVVQAVEEPVAAEPEPQQELPKEEPAKAAPPKEEPREEPVPAAPAKENVPPAQAPTVAIEFDVSGKMETVIAVRKPLGIIFAPGKANTVGSLRQGSHGEELGVKPDWIMKKIGGEDVSNVKVEQLLELVRRRTADLPTDAKSVEITFSDVNGQDVPILASRLPFGASFNQSAPLTVKEVNAGGHAGSLGVQSGWKVKAIAGTSVSGMAFGDAWGLFQKSLESLPKV